MTGLDSPEFQQLARKCDRGKALVSLSGVAGSICALCSIAMNEFYENDVVFWLLFAVCVAACAAVITGVVLQIYIHRKYTRRLYFLLAQWTADRLRESGVLDGKANVVLHFSVEQYTATFLREGTAAICTFDFAPIANRPSALSAANGLALGYIRAFYYRASAGKVLPDNVAIIDKTGRKPKSIPIVSGGNLVGNKGEKNYFIKHHIL